MVVAVAVVTAAENDNEKPSSLGPSTSAKMREQMEKDEAGPRDLRNASTNHSCRCSRFKLFNEGLTRHLSSIDTGVMVLRLLKTYPKARVKMALTISTVD